MKLNISSNRTVGEIQHDFNVEYPFLKLDFYPVPGKKSFAIKQRLNKTALLPETGERGEAVMKIIDSMTVGTLEKMLRETFGMTVQVSRKSGILWLETTMTDNWTLKQQNDHGRELSEPQQKDLIPGDAGIENNDR